MPSTSPILGLVLAGGRSARMGQDKALISYHGKPQYQHVFELLSSVCDAVYVSCRAEQKELFAPLPVLLDSVEDIGPMAALLAAFEYNPNCAWLVLGCDYPHFGEAELQQLLDQRDEQAIATAYFNAAKGWPEPLLAIWEPQAHPLMKAALAIGDSSLRRLLEANPVKLVHPAEATPFKSFDTPTDRQSFTAS